MSVKTDNTQTLVNALAEIERLKRLVAEYKQRSENLCDALVSHIEWESEQPQMKSWLLRKQSEAVEAVIKRIREARHEVDRTSVEESDTACTLRIAESIAIGEAQRLRQQADEPENNNG